MENRLVTCPVLIAVVLVAQASWCPVAVVYIQVDMDIGLPDTSVCSCTESFNCAVKLRAVVALKDARS